MAERPFRPSNGTDGHSFIAHFCGHCTKDGSCDIVGRTMAFDVTDSNYPKEWVADDDGAECTAFVEKERGNG